MAANNYSVQACAWVKNSLEGDAQRDKITLRSVWCQTELRLSGMESAMGELHAKLHKLEEDHRLLSARKEAIFKEYSLLRKEENPSIDEDDTLCEIKNDIEID
jgi:hypothetical protein